MDQFDRGYEGHCGVVCVRYCSLHSAGMCQPEIPALCLSRQPALLRVLPLLFVPICAKAVSQPLYRATSTVEASGTLEGPLLYPKFPCVHGQTGCEEDGRMESDEATLGGGGKAGVDAVWCSVVLCVI